MMFALTYTQKPINRGMPNMKNYKPEEIIATGKAVMGMELGSTRIKAVLVGPDNSPLASGGYRLGKQSGGRLLDLFPRRGMEGYRRLLHRSPGGCKKEVRC